MKPLVSMRLFFFFLGGKIGCYFEGSGPQEMWLEISFTIFIFIHSKTVYWCDENILNAKIYHQLMYTVELVM